MRKIIFGMLVMLSFVLGEYAAWAANYSDPIDGVFKGIYGDTVSVIVPSLVSKSPASNENQDGMLSFQVNPATVYSNFSQLTDIKDGDPVRITYTADPTAKDKQMVATQITKLDPETETNEVNTGTNPDLPSPPATQTVITTTTTQVHSQ